MMDLISMLGYSDKSPYKHNPYLDINTPDGKISMADTSVDLVGMDNTGMVQHMKANNQEPYQFDGDVVREILLKKGGLTKAQYALIRGLKLAHNKGDFDNISPNKARKILHDKKVAGRPLTPDQYKLFGYLSKGHTLKFEKGGNNPYAQGGFTHNQLLSFLFEDDNGDPPNGDPPAKKKNNSQELAHVKNNRLLAAREQEELAMEQANMSLGNPYRRDEVVPIVQTGNPFKATNLNFYEESQKYKGLPYKFAGTGEGGVDCSGYVCKVVGLPRTSSEEIVKNASNFRRFTGDTNEFAEGTVIGFDTGKTSFDAGRKYGMDHVGVIIKNPYTGELEYTHSAGSTGVATMSIQKMLSKYKGTQMYLGDYGKKN